MVAKNPGIELTYAWAERRMGPLFILNFWIVEHPTYQEKQYRTEMFFTNSAIRDAIAVSGASFGRFLTTTANYDFLTRTLHFDSFEQAGRSKVPFELQKLGVFLIAELKFLQQVKRDFPDVEWIEHAKLSEDRVSKLRAMGIVIEDSARPRYSFELGIRALRSYIRNKSRLYRSNDQHRLPPTWQRRVKFRYLAWRSRRRNKRKP